MILQSAKDLQIAPSRIVSLVPSQTELLWHLQLEDETIGITKFCVHPSHWRTVKTVVGGTKNIHLSKIATLSPDLVIANKEENVKEQVEELSTRYPVWVTDVNNLTDALNMILDVGLLTSRTQKAQHLVQEIQIAFSQLKKIHLGVKVAYLIWQDPLMAVGSNTFIHDMLLRCGFNNIFGDRARYPQVTIEEILEMNCELLLLSSEPYPFDQRHLTRLQASLPRTKIMLVDGELFSWYGSRLLQSAAYLNKLVTEIDIKL
jgi:ABC-type Fe3+-hydroxamate transport system substrate-binding protein